MSALRVDWVMLLEAVDATKKVNNVDEVRVRVWAVNNAIGKLNKLLPTAVSLAERTFGFELRPVPEQPEPAEPQKPTLQARSEHHSQGALAIGLTNSSLATDRYWAIFNHWAILSWFKLRLFFLYYQSRLQNNTYYN